MTYLFLGLSYLLGATPTSFWVGRVFHGLDLREHGSGNLGATNAFRVLGLKSALPVVFVDVAKGWIPVWLFADVVGAGFEWAFAYGLAAILGHMFSFWVGFKGGKGMATSAGVFLGFAPLAVLAGFVLWLGFTLSFSFPLHLPSSSSGSIGRTSGGYAVARRTVSVSAGALSRRFLMRESPLRQALRVLPNNHERVRHDGSPSGDGYWRRFMGYGSRDDSC